MAANSCGNSTAASNDPEIRALTASEAMEAMRRTVPSLQGIFPASWISANFDVWIGHAEDVRAWDLLRDAREVYAEARSARGTVPEPIAPGWRARMNPCSLPREAIGIGGTARNTVRANDAEFDALYRKHLTEIYTALGEQPRRRSGTSDQTAPELGRREPPDRIST